MAAPITVGGFRVEDYDPDTESVTIKIKRLVVKHSGDALAQKLVAVIEGDDRVKAVHVKVED
jgi:hypothetical protein